MKHNQLRRNFTIVELLTVVAIIAVLVGIVMGLMSLASSKMCEARTKSLISQISVALESYKAKYGYYIQQSTAMGFYLDKIDKTSATPSAEQKITNNFCQFIDYENLTRKDGQLDTDGRYRLLDGYGNPMIYRCPGYFNRNGFDFGSVGSDGKFGNSTVSSATVTLTTDLSKFDPVLGTYKTYYTTNFGQGDDMTNFTR